MIVTTRHRNQSLLSEDKLHFTEEQWLCSDEEEA